MGPDSTPCSPYFAPSRNRDTYPDDMYPDSPKKLNGLRKLHPNFLLTCGQVSLKPPYELVVRPLRRSALCIRFLGRYSEALGEPIFALPVGTTRIHCAPSNPRNGRRSIS
jgi:hypothetical protein